MHILKNKLKKMLKRIEKEEAKDPEVGMTESNLKDAYWLAKTYTYVCEASKLMKEESDESDEYEEKNNMI